MRIARVLGTVTISKRLPELRPGRYILAEALDSEALYALDRNARRSKPMPESLVVYDELGAGPGQLIALSEGGEATQAFKPDRVPIDAYCAAIIDTIDMTRKEVAAHG